MMLAIGLYIGFGLGWATFTVVETGFGAGVRLLWRLPILILFWPAFFAAPFIHKL